MAPAGGIERVIASHISFLNDTHEIILLTKDDEPSFYTLPENIRIYSLLTDFKLNMNSRWQRVAKILASTLGTCLALRKQFKITTPDIVYVASPLNLLEVVLAGINCKNIIVTEHSSFSAYNLIYKTIIFLFYPRLGLLMVPTKLDSNYYRKHGIANSYLPNPITIFPDHISNLSSKWAICVGRLTDDKRHDLLLDIWDSSGIHRLGWKLKIIGKGECESNLKNKINAMNLSDSVVIKEPTPKIQDEFIASSIFLLTSRAEGFGLVLAEAMACGVPCISFDCPSGPRDIIDDGKTGRLLQEGDIGGYALALRDIATNSSLRVMLGLNARLAAKKFHSETIRIKFNNFFNQTFC